MLSPGQSLFALCPRLTVAVMAHCTISVSFLRHILKRLDMLVEWGFPELCHTVVLQTLTDEKLKMQHRTYWSSYNFLQGYILSCIYHKLPLMESFLYRDTEQNPRKGLN